MKNVTSTRLNEKQGNYWIKIIEDVTWDAEEYKQSFYFRFNVLNYVL